jgi:cytochrome c peroxidase
VHDVGTADAIGEWFGPLIDTPTLRFLYDSAPYLHDGSAATLRDILTHANPGDVHGVTSHLAEREIADLVAFMLALPYSE